jgi:uncharacterized membrane protein YeaQ/YmgE (transglycosylase-associated protein family)
MTEGRLASYVRLPKDPDGIFHLAAAVIAGLILVWLVSSVRIVPEVTLLLLGFLAIGGIGVVWTPPLVFALIAIILFQIPNHFLGVIPNFDAPLSTKELFLGAAFVIYSTLSYRYARIRRLTSHVNIAIDSEPLTNSKPEQISFGRVAGLFLTIASGLVIAFLAHWFLPFLFIGRQWADVFHLHPGVLGFLFAVLLLGAVSLIWPAIVRGIGRWGMNKEEGEMILNESLFRDLWPDITRMARFRQKLDRKRK